MVKIFLLVVIGVLGYDVVKKTLEAGRESRDPGSKYFCFHIILV